MQINFPERLAGDGVVLRRLRADDAGAYAGAFGDDPELGRWLGVERDPDEQAVRRRVEDQVKRAADGTGLEVAIADPATDALPAR